MCKKIKKTYQPNNQTSSQSHFDEAKKVLVGGVNSPVRAFKSVDSSPIFMSHGQGAHIFSEDGRQYIDYVLAYGPHLLGHVHPSITKAIQQASSKGTALGAPTTAETTLAKWIQKFYPGIEKIRFVNSGTEATMSAIRLARGVTKRDKIIKFDGCYHGHVDSLLVKTGSGGLTLGQPDSGGIPETIANNTISIPYNDIEAFKEVMSLHGETIAGVIIEPVAGNMGTITPKEGFLEALADTCQKNKSLLIFDEVMIGFRSGIQSIQAKKNIKADITCLGKVMGGGLPCGAFGGSEKIMSHLAPDGEIYQAGTLSGNPICTAAGIAMLYKLTDENIYKKLEKTMNTLVDGIKEIIKKYNAPIQIQHYGTMFTIFFSDKTVQNLNDAKNCDLEAFKKFHKHMINKGIYMAPSQYESAFISTEHNDLTNQETIDAIEEFLQNGFKK